MDQKQKWLLMSGMLVLTFVYMQVIYPRLAEKYHWKTPEMAATQPATVSPSPSVVTGMPATSATTGPTTVAVGEVRGAAAPVDVVIGSTDYAKDGKHPESPFPLGVTINNRGAGVESVTLNRFKDQYDQPKPYVFQKPYAVSSPLATPLATRWVMLNGASPVALDTVNWNPVTPTSGPATNLRSASFAIDIPDASGKPQLRITKTYELRDKDDKSAGYEMVVSHALQNLTGKPMTVKLGFNGTTSPKPENSRDLPEVVAGFDGGHQNINISHSPIGSVNEAKPLDVRAMNEEPLEWSGMTSAYFDAIVRPTDAAGKRLPIDQAKAILLNPDVKDSTQHAVALDYTTGELTVPAAGNATFALNVYVGPKLRNILKSDYYVNFPLSYDETLVLRNTSGFGAICGLCTWPFLINFLVYLLQGFHFLLRDWGLAIIALVCLVRLILHPITKRSQISMSRMTKMGPEMERLKAKHKDDPEALKKAQMEFYREQGVAPFLGCLPMFLQMPIWIALWSSLQSTFEIRHAPFLWGWTWIKDLSQPDRLIAFHAPINFWQFHIDAINILPVFMAVVFFIQQKFQPQPVAATPEQEQQQKMMKWMSIFLFPLFLYGQPSGLNLYIFTSTLIGIIESKRIRDHIKERDEKAKAGVVIIDGPPGKRDDLSGGTVRRAKTPPEKPAGGGAIAGFLAKMQQMADQAKQEQERKLKKGNKR